MRRRGPQGLRLVFEDGADLLLIHAGESFDKLADRSTAGQIFIQRQEWNPRARKHPGTANSPRYVFDGGAGLPVSHFRHLAFANSIHIVSHIQYPTPTARALPG